MNALPRLAIAAGLALCLAGPSCKRTTESGTSGPDRAKAVRKPRPPGMPQPLRLPDHPVAAVHLQSPDEVLRTAAAYTPQPDDDDPIALLRRLSTRGGDAFEAKVAPWIDPTRAWDGAVVEGQSIVHVPIARSHLDDAARLLSGLPAEGKFGAVALARPPGEHGPKLAYLDRDAATLTLADTLPGIATGRELARAYGKQPFFVTVDATQARAWGVELPVQRVTVRGQGLHAFELETEGVPRDIPDFDKLADGALPGILEAPQVAVGVSTRYAQHEQTVRTIISRATRTVEKQSFLVRGNLEDLLRRANAVLRSWNGRVMVGIGPSRHVLLAFGTDDPKKTDGALVHFMTGVMSNLGLAKSLGFGSSVPSVRFQKKKLEVNGVPIHVVALENARKQVPPELAALVDARGDLRVAIAFPPRAGTGMFVAGPDASNVLADWLQQIADATPANDSRGDLLAATLAVEPSALVPVLQDATGSQVLSLSAGREPTKIVLRRQGDRLRLLVVGPKLAASPPARQPPTAHRTPPNTARTTPTSARRTPPNASRTVPTSARPRK